jgi:hypothetical protein
MSDSVDIAVEYNSPIHRQEMLEDLKHKGFIIKGNTASNGNLTYYFMASQTFDKNIQGMLVDDIVGALTPERLMRIKSCRKTPEQIRSDFPKRSFTL